MVQRHLSSPLLQGNESESHRTLRAQTNKSSEALVRRQGTPDLLTESLTIDQLCGVHARESVPATVLSGRTPHNGDRHKTELLLSSTKVPISRSTKGCDRGT